MKEKEKKEKKEKVITNVINKSSFLLKIFIFPLCC